MTESAGRFLGDRVRMAMNHLPGAGFETKDRRNPYRHRGHFFTSPDFGTVSLHFDHVREFRRHVLRDLLEPDDGALSVVGCSPRERLRDLWPCPSRRAEGVGEGGVVLSRVQRFQGTRIPLHECAQRSMVVLDRCVEIARRGGNSGRRHREKISTPRRSTPSRHSRSAGSRRMPPA